MRFIRKGRRVPAALILDLAQPPCNWQEPDKVCGQPGRVFDADGPNERALCAKHLREVETRRADRA